MQRIAREASPAGSGPHTAIDRYALLEQHCSSLVTDLYAVPRRGQDNIVEWWSNRGGQPVPYAQLGAAQQTNLLETYRQRLADIRQTADALAARGDAQAAADLRKFLIDKPDLASLYSIDQTPVLTAWDRQEPSPVLPPPPIAPVTAPIATAPDRGRWMWLWALLLLLLLAALIWWFFFKKEPNLEVPVPPPAPPVGAPIEPPAPPPSAPVSPPPPPPSAPEPDLIHPPTAAPGKPPEPTCVTPPGEPGPEFVVVLDTSGSMQLNISATRADELWFFSMSDNQRENLRGRDLARADRIFEAPTRYQVAVNAMGKMLDGLPKSVDTGLITYAGCKHPVKQGVFSASQRPALMSALRALSPVDGTPMAASLRAAADMVDGVNRDAVILVFVDGEDGCEEDQCAVAAQIAKDKPRLKVNVVDLTGANLSSCIAKNTGGQVFSSQDVKAIPRLLQKAGSQALAETMCKTAEGP